MSAISVVFRKLEYFPLSVVSVEFKKLESYFANDGMALSVMIFGTFGFLCVLTGS